MNTSILVATIIIIVVIVIIIVVMTSEMTSESENCYLMWSDISFGEWIGEFGVIFPSELKIKILNHKPKVLLGKPLSAIVKENDMSPNIAAIDTKEINIPEVFQIDEKQIEFGIIKRETDSLVPLRGLIDRNAKFVDRGNAHHYYTVSETNRPYYKLSYYDCNQEWFDERVQRCTATEKEDYSHLRSLYLFYIFLKN